MEEENFLQNGIPTLHPDAAADKGRPLRPLPIKCIPGLRHRGWQSKVSSDVWTCISVRSEEADGLDNRSDFGHASVLTLAVLMLHCRPAPLPANAAPQAAQACYNSAFKLSETHSWGMCAFCCALGPKKDVHHPFGEERAPPSPNLRHPDPLLQRKASALFCCLLRVFPTPPPWNCHKCRTPWEEGGYPPPPRPR